MTTQTRIPKENLLILVDGSSYLHRAFHALPALTNSQGEQTGAIYGVINMLRKLITDYQPKHIAVVFDAKGKNFRHELYTDYKANRAAMVNELSAQIPPLYTVIEAMGLPILSIPGVEADDVIGTLAKHAAHTQMNVLVATGDKDLAQIVNPHVTLIDTMSNKMLDEAGVQEKFGVPPDKITEYLALVGDTSDNIPGIPNVGPKTAVKWLNAYGSLENIVKKADEITGKVGENLRENLTTLPIAQQLATIKDNVELDCTIKDLTPKAADKEKLIELFKRYEFRSWLSPLLNETGATASAQTQEQKNAVYEIILTEKQLRHWLEKLKQAPLFAIDTETTSLNFMDARLVGISFAIEPEKAAYIPLTHDYLGAPQQLDRDYVLAEIRHLLESKTHHKIGQNLKYDYHVFANHGINLQGISFDTMLESYVLNSTAGRHDLDTLAIKHLGFKITSFEDIAGKGTKQLTFNQIHLDQAAPYAAKDADIVLRLHEIFLPKLQETPNLLHLLQKIEIPLLSVLARIERNGVCIDAAALKKQSHELAKRIDELEQETYHLAGEVFNLASPKQLQEILFHKLKLPITEKTPTGQPSTAESVLQELALDHQLPRLLLEYRTLSKLKSTYTDSLPEQINPHTNRVHTSYNQAITATGRLSSTDPNLQNIPARSDAGRRIRQAFIAPSGYKIISADYSQIELRIMAHLSKDEGLLKAFSIDGDVHRATAAEVFGVALKDVTAEQRQRAKAINFGLIYGMSAFGLARQIGVEREEAQVYMNSYFARYPGVKIYMEQARESAREQGFVETIFGRRLYVPDIKAQNFLRRSAAERAAINAPMQGTAADIMKIAMINVDKWLNENEPSVNMIMQVHDELVFEVQERYVKEVSFKIKELMENAVKLAVPVIVQVGVGDNWDEAH